MLARKIPVLVFLIAVAFVVLSITGSAWGFISLWMALGLTAMVVLLHGNGAPWGFVDGGALVFSGPFGLVLVLTA